MNIHKRWMKYALSLAKIAKKNKDIPVGAVLINNNKIIGEGWNQTVKNNDPTAHAEIIALRKGGNFLKNYRLINSTLYVTLEPCIMCFGAILHSRIKCVVFSLKNKKFGWKKTLLNIKNTPLKIYFKIKIIEGIFSDISSKMLKDFFKKKR